MIKKCTNIAKQFYDKIGQEEEIDYVSDSGNDFHESANADDSLYNSEETPIN